jgi:hypothetical protein
MQPSSMGWDGFQCSWVAFVGKFASKKKMDEKFVLSPEKELGYEGIVIKLEEVLGVGGGLLRGGDNCFKEGNWIGLLEKNKTFRSMVCCTSSTLRLECNNDVQHFYMLQDIKLYIVGF